MKTLLDIDNNILKDYTLWENENKNNWNIASYLNQFHDINAALAFSKLFFPDFIEREGCIILNFRYHEKVFNQWYEEFEGDTKKVEKLCNLYDVADYFHINSALESPNVVHERTVNELAKALKASWEANCKLLFPEKNMLALVYKEYGVTRITLYNTTST